MSDPIAEESGEVVEPENNALTMSDEDISSMSFEEFEKSSPATTEEVSAEEDTLTADVEEEEDGEVVIEDTEPTTVEEPDDTTEGDDDNEEDATAAEKTTEDGEEKNESDISKIKDLDRIFKPFNANGKEIQVNNVDEVIQLMQMGANYNKKMAALKPNLKLLKTLENNDLLDEGKLNYLIDLEKKNPEAIKKLLKDSKIDPIELDLESNEDYVPNTYNANDTEVELDAILEEIQDTPTYNETISVVGTKWDEQSRGYLANNPQIIKLINQHMATGVFKQVSDVVEREKVLGRLVGLTDLEAYKKVGDELFANRAAAPTTQPIVKRPTSKKSDPEITNKKKAAGSTKAKATATKPAEFNPLSLSDDEFEKLSSGKYA